MHSPSFLLLATAAFGTSYSTTFYDTYNFDPLKHLSGIAPYFEPADPPTDPNPPQGCSVTRTAYLVRHAAINANDFDYESYVEPFVAKLKNHTTIDWSRLPDLSFLSTWTSPISTSEQEIVTRVGKQEANQLGVELALKYPNLALPAQVWASSAERTVVSAQSLIAGLEMSPSTVNLTVIPEGEEDGANSLTPYKSCPAYSSSAGSDQASEFMTRYTAPITARLNAQAPQFNFTAADVYGMQQLCGYETVIRGASPFCSLRLFSPDEWLAWEYANDIMYHYNTGYGSPVAGAIGLPWATATTDLLLADAPAPPQDMYISFTHRELPPVVLVALGLFNNSAFAPAADVNASMPATAINHRRAWRSSHILPFLTHIGVERLNCSASFGFAPGDYYRVLVNESPQPLPACGDGPGTSCSRAGLQALMRERTALFGGFGEKCGVTYGNSTDVLRIYEEGGAVANMSSSVPERRL